MASDWREHTNAMTVEERASALLGSPSFYRNSVERSDLIAFGNVCVAAEKRRAHTAEGKLEAAEKELEIVRAAANMRQEPLPQCPVTGRDFFMTIQGEDGKWYDTYGGPFDSYTIPKWNGEDQEFRSDRYDHDADCWVDGGEPYPFILVDESEQNERIEKLEDLAAENTRLREALHKIADDDYCIGNVLDTAREALAATPATAEWLAAHDAQVAARAVAQAQRMRPMSEAPRKKLWPDYKPDVIKVLTRHTEEVRLAFFDSDEEPIVWRAWTHSQIGWRDDELLGWWPLPEVTR